MTDWPGYVRSMFAMLKPNGWADFGDYVEDTFYSDESHGQPREDWEWLRALRAGGLKKGLDLDCGLNIEGYMREAGFVDIQRWEYRVPLWREGIREEERRIAEHLIDDRWGLYWHMLPRMLDGMGYSVEEIDRLRSEMRRDLRAEEGKQQMFAVTVGRKPG